MHRPRRDADHIRFETEVVSARWDDARRCAGRSRCARADGHRGDRRGGGHQRRRPAQPAQAARHPGRRHLRGPGHALRPSGTEGADLAGKRVAVIGTGASAFQIVPTIAPDGRAPHRVPAVGAVDVPQPALPRPRRRRRPMGARAPAVLRPLVPVPALLARLRRWPAGHDRRPGVAPSRAGRERHQRRRPRDVHPVHGRPGRRRPRAAAPRWCPTTCASASAPCRTTAAGWGAHPRQRRAGHGPHRRDPGRSGRRARAGPSTPST